MRPPLGRGGANGDDGGAIQKCPVHLHGPYRTDREKSSTQRARPYSSPNEAHGRTFVNFWFHCLPVTLPMEAFRGSDVVEHVNANDGGGDDRKVGSVHFLLEKRSLSIDLKSWRSLKRRWSRPQMIQQVIQKLDDATKRLLLANWLDFRIYDFSAHEV